ncbi:MAG: YncE family protein [bacterium]|nr:YncE family protein [bacterium]
MDPVTARFRDNGEVWVVNHISDSVSIVDVPTLRVRATLATDDEPADVVFAGKPVRAFVSCSQANTVLVFEPDDLGKKPKRVKIGAEDPRAMAASPNGKTVYVAIFESGNRSTVLAGGFDIDEQSNRPTIPRNVVSDPAGPYGGQNPPPNRGGSFEPPIASNLLAPPPVALIVKKNAADRWVDDNGADWTEFVSGSQAFKSKRVSGWDVLDRDVATINAKNLRVGYLEGLANLVMAVAVNPASGRVSAVGTEGINEVRFEPVLNGRFLRVNLALVGPDGSSRSIVDLNPHLTYESARVPQAARNRSIGDPRAIVWNQAGTRAWVAGMGSNNVVVVDSSGERVGATIEVGQGAAGLALDDGLGRLYVLNRFAATISVVDVDSGKQILRKKFSDPTPKAIRKGRPLLYDTHKTSGLGHVSCASCHADARTDRLAWDLGAPDGEMKSNADQNKSLIPQDSFPPDWHPMKGPMATQTLQDIVGKEPHHWRGDRDGLEEFAEAFRVLLGDDKKLSRSKMKKFEKFLATIHFPPNPFRNFDNSLPTSVSLTDHHRSGRFGNEGASLPKGNARRGLELFRTGQLESDTMALDLLALRARAAPGAELTFTVVAPGTGSRIAFARARDDTGKPLETVEAIESNSDARRIRRTTPATLEKEISVATDKTAQE